MNKLKKILIGGLGILSLETYGQCHDDFQLLWADEFNADTINTDNWVVKEGGGGFGNQEVQYYQPENASVSGGSLHIKVAKDTVVDGSTTYYYTSAKLETASKKNFLYGKMEARIKMPNVLGSWPAFWMLGSNINTVPWPHCGEIDIMEWVGRGPDAVTGSMFFDGVWPNNHISTPYNIPFGGSFINDYHTFAIEWEPNEIRYYCDGNKYATYKNTTIAPKEWVFNHEFFLILNCAIGGTGGGNTIVFDNPQYMEVDYVRVYSLPSTADSIVVAGPKVLMENTQNVLYTTTYLPNTTYTWSLPNGATIVDGQGTNSVHVNFATEGGQVKATAVNSCTTLADSVSLNLLADGCSIVYDNLEDARNVSYTSTGTLTENVANPAPNAVNASADVAKYERNALETYDVLRVYDIALESALGYENSSKVFFMDVLTDAPLNTQITLQLESSALNAGPYPQGRRSAYIGRVTKQNEWHTVKFNFSSVISTATLPDKVDQIAFLFDPAHTTGNVYYFDNFKRLKNASGCDPIITDITTHEAEQFVSLYPNPVSNRLQVNEKIESLQFSIYNALGEKVLESTEHAIDVSGLPNGLYVLKTDTHTLRFVKQ